MNDSNFTQINKHAWDQVVDIHLKSEFYDVAGFLSGKSSLNEIELSLLGDLRGKKVLHLQCHFGQDSISLSRLGATVTGVDFSENAISAAKALAVQTESDAKFIAIDINDLPSVLKEEFDIVFTSYGTICWHADLKKWALIISQYLKPGGQFVFAEFHPAVWMFDNDLAQITHSYFNEGPIMETTNGTYAQNDADISQESITWNHSIADVLNSLIREGLELQVFNEYDYAPYNCWSDSVEFEPKKFRSKLKGKIPMVYALSATKK